MRQIVSQTRRIIKHNSHKKRVFNIPDFYKKRNQILILRGCGGLGDILMHRMIFEDFKLLCPQIEIHFACPSVYHDAVIDHPYIDKVLDARTVDVHDYIISYSTTTACGRYELKKAPFADKHRSDIWANHCGIKLTKHNMHINLSKEEIKEGKEIINKYRTSKHPVVLFCPISASIGKNLLPHQIYKITKYLLSKNFNVIGLHKTRICELDQMDIPVICNISIRQWMSVIYNSDYVISVDTSHFHCAGGLGKPLVGIFSYVDGYVYGKYYDCIIVQKHRNTHTNWSCGPCYNWGECKKETRLGVPKPCITELQIEEIIAGIEKMFDKWPI